MITTNLGPATLCDGDCLTVLGQQYCGYGNYTATGVSYTGCDSVVTFSIVPPNLVADILGGGTITCSNPTVTLNSLPSPGIKTWSDAAGQTVGTGNTLTVNSPGAYTLSVSTMAGTEICTLTDNVTVLLNTTPPVVMAQDALMGCDTVPLLLQVSSPNHIAQYIWLGPNGFNAQVQYPPVTELGTYVVTAIDSISGCAGVDTITVGRCCIFAGTMDTLLQFACPGKNVLANFYGNQNIGSTDSLVFILYTDASDPLGSILMQMATPEFPFISGLVQMDSIYYVAAIAWPIQPNNNLEHPGACFSLSAGQPVMWVHKPTIAVNAPPTAVCKGSCVDVTFQFTGAPPFQFHYEIWQTGVLLLSKDETTDALQKTITVCPADFLQPPGTDPLDFKVNFLQDMRCGCGD